MPPVSAASHACAKYRAKSLLKEIKVRPKVLIVRERDNDEDTKHFHRHILVDGGSRWSCGRQFSTVPVAGSTKYLYCTRYLVL
jgi:hypothetical protein